MKLTHFANTFLAAATISSYIAPTLAAWGWENIGARSLGIRQSGGGSGSCPPGHRCSSGSSFVCCDPSTEKCQDGRCQPKFSCAQGKKECGATACCDPSIEKCENDLCVLKKCPEDSRCGSVCCPTGQQCKFKECKCPITQTTCNQNCCDRETEKCDGGECKPLCNTATQIICGTSCCDKSTQQCDGSTCKPLCDAATQTTCGTSCCDKATQQCDGSTCKPKCSDPSKVCGSNCCSESERCDESGACVSICTLGLDYCPAIDTCCDFQMSCVGGQCVEDPCGDTLQPCGFDSCCANDNLQCVLFNRESVCKIKLLKPCATATECADKDVYCYQGTCQTCAAELGGSCAGGVRCCNGGPCSPHSICCDQLLQSGASCDPQADCCDFGLTCDLGSNNNYVCS